MQPSNDHWKNSTSGSNLLCMALCEIVNDTAGYKSFDWGYTIQDETIITTRYLLVWPNGNSNFSYNNNTLADSLKLPKRLYQD
jgi:hypothetical protein